MSIETGLIFIMVGVIAVDITQSVARIVVNGKDLPFTSLQFKSLHGIMDQ